MAEPRLVVANREDLWWLLAEASQLEHMIMCQYLFAEFSLKTAAGEGLTADQVAAVERWRTTLRVLAERARDVAAADGAPAAVKQAQQRVNEIAATLTLEVPAGSSF